jgi:hypothetical protein
MLKTAAVQVAVPKVEGPIQPTLTLPTVKGTDGTQ